MTDDIRSIGAGDVAEACADALLTACAQVLILGNYPTDAKTGRADMSDCRMLAYHMIEQVIERAWQEGPKPR